MVTMTEQELAALRERAEEAAKVLQGTYTIPQPRYYELCEEFAANLATYGPRAVREIEALLQVFTDMSRQRDEVMRYRHEAEHIVMELARLDPAEIGNFDLVRKARKYLGIER